MSRDVLFVECAWCGTKDDIPCRETTHFYSERAQDAAARGWGVVVVPGRAILYFCEDHGDARLMAAALRATTSSRPLQRDYPLTLSLLNPQLLRPRDE